MAPRPHWNGFLKLSFVTCPISLYPAITPAERVSFRQVNRQTGNRLRQQLVDTVTGDVVDPLDKARGYEVGENKFVVVEDEELKGAKEEAKAHPFIEPPLSQPPFTEKRAAPRGKPVVVAPPLAPAATSPVAPRPKPVSRTIEILRFVPFDQLDSRYRRRRLRSSAKPIEKPYYIVPRGPVAWHRSCGAVQSRAGYRHSAAWPGLAGCDFALPL
jgi:hypothetical protein